jgi:hypothetical protein
MVKSWLLPVVGFSRGFQGRALGSGCAISATGVDAAPQGMGFIKPTGFER